MASFLRDMQREHGKMQSDLQHLNRHYEQLQSYMQQYIRQTTMEWARLVQDHPGALLLIVETTLITDKDGYHVYGNQNEPIRFTGLSLASSEMWDQLIRPTHSEIVTGEQYHGLTTESVEDKPTIEQAWADIQARLEGHHLIVFGLEWARLALQPVSSSRILDHASCLHNRCKEYYGEFYELGLEKILGYQGINSKREALKDSRDRILMQARIIHNLADGMEKQSQESDSLDDSLSDHPF